MKKYTIKQVSELLGLPKATLRYYDQLGIVSPHRADNGYRYYNEQDILNLKYAEVMKRINCSLMEIKQIMDFRQKPNLENFPIILQMIDEKQNWLSSQIELFQASINYLELITKTMQEKTKPEDAYKLDMLINQIFHAKN
ncbi:MAG: MerR family transcriptional regulator [Defluviitaleaceae bacterium]|nr:MerR family transcriptional regulator [Defluviitaleaceae bacterium]